MSFLSEYDALTRWKYTPISGTFPTHPDLGNKVDSTGAFRDFPGSTVVFHLERRQARYLNMVKDFLHAQVGDMLAAPLPQATLHMTLHDLICPEQLGLLPVEQGAEPPKGSLKELVALSLGRAAKVVDELREAHGGERIEMLADRVVNMVSKSVVLMLRPATEADVELLIDLYRRFDPIVALSNPLTPHVTLAYFKPGMIEGDRLARAVEQIQVCGRDPMPVSLSLQALTAQRFDSMSAYEDVPTRLCVCCDGGMNRSVMIAAVLNALAARRGIPLRAEARAAYPNTSNRPIPSKVASTLARHGISPESIPLKVRYLEAEEVIFFSRFAAVSGGALMRFDELGIGPEKSAGEVFQGLRDPQYTGDYESVFEEALRRASDYLDDFESRHSHWRPPVKGGTQ